MTKYQVVIGRTEKIDLIDRFLGIPAKVDTGAYRSSIHARNIKVTTKNGAKTLSCDLLGHPCSPESVKFETTKFTRVSVTSSFGAEEKRYEIVLKVKVGPKVFNTSFTLADRSNNLFPILIGRKLLKGRFMVDVSKSGVDRTALKKGSGVKWPTDEEDME